MRSYFWFLLFFNALLSGGSPAKAEWREATTDHFVIVSGGSETQIRQMAMRLEALHWLLSTVTGVDTSGQSQRVRIFLVGDVDDVHRAMGVDGSSLAAGFYRPRTEGAIAVVPRDSADSAQIYLFHEYTHHFMLQYLSIAYPLWYSEGFSEVMSTSTFGFDGTISYGQVAQHRAYELGPEDWVPADRMFAPLDKDDPRAGRASYGEYWLAAHYFIFSPQRKLELRRYFDALSRGQSLEEAAQNFTGGMRQVDRDLRRYLSGNRFAYQTIMIPPTVQRAPDIRSLRPGEAAIVYADLNSRRTLPAETLAPMLSQVAGIASRYPDDPAVQFLHARLLNSAARYADAMAAVDRVLALEPGHVRALVLKSEILIRQRSAGGATIDADTLAQARRLIVRANRIDPDDPIPLIAFYETYGVAGQTPPDVVMAGLEKASDIVPQVPELRLTLAVEWLNRNENARARSALVPLAFSAHRTDEQAYALRLVQWIDAGAQGPRPEPETSIVIDG